MGSRFIICLLIYKIPAALILFCFLMWHCVQLSAGLCKRAVSASQLCNSTSMSAASACGNDGGSLQVSQLDCTATSLLCVHCCILMLTDCRRGSATGHSLSQQRWCCNAATCVPCSTAAVVFVVPCKCMRSMPDCIMFLLQPIAC